MQEIRLTENTSTAVDVLAETLHELHHLADKTQNQYILLDLRLADMEHLRQLILHMRDIKRIYQHQAPSFFAMVLAENMLIDIADALLKTLSQREQVQYFINCTSATLWLRLEQKKHDQRTQSEAHAI